MKQGNLPSVMKHQFSKVPSVAIERSTFDRSHGLKTTFDAGTLIPMYWDEVLPGDTYNLRMNGFARLATPLKPIMDNLHMETFFFFVPNRLLWTNWEKFCGAQDDPADSVDFTIPTLTEPDPAGHLQGSIGDYFGLPTKEGSAVAAEKINANALHFRAYNLIYSQWFRDENLQDTVVTPLDDGPDAIADFALLQRGKRHDYFTSALPWPQKTVTSVSLPLGTSAPVISPTGLAFAAKIRQSSDDAVLVSNTLGTDAGGLLHGVTGTIASYLDPNTTLIADLTNATAATINALREAEQLQVMYERDARGGTRYIEIIRNHFRVTSDDARLQRPEYLGGGHTNVNIHPSEQTSVTGSTPQANLAAIGTASFNGHGFNKSFTEHGVLIGLVCVRADLSYQQGVDRMWNRQTRFDYYWPALSHLGEQSILNRELYYVGASTSNGVFGYQERYAEYKYKKSAITGLFRSNATGTLDVWHLAQEFSSLPTLGNTFIKEAVPLDRVIAVPAEPHFIFDAYFHLTCARPMPVYAVPQLGSRF